MNELPGSTLGDKDGDGERDALGNVLAAAVKVLESIACIILFAMMLLTFADVVGRYLFASPIFGASEMISSMLAVLIFAGLGVTNSRDDHIVVELLDHKFRSLSPKYYDLIIQAFSVVTMCLIAFVLAEHAIEAHDQKALTYVLEMPTWIVTSSVALLAFISVLSLLAGIVLRLRGASIDHRNHPS